ncbi:MAG: hypothetical protein LBD20_09435 [Spirochaetaceae bacterium]|nr:hypothetical protein [Spirochaetaceae bacterium]
MQTPCLGALRGRLQKSGVLQNVPPLQIISPAEGVTENTLKQSGGGFGVRGDFPP